MSHLFNKRFEEMKEGDPTSKGDTVKQGDTNYPDNGQGRTLSFVWPDGRIEFLNYAYLIGGGYDPASQIILLSFTTHTVELRGESLSKLIEDLTDHKTKMIVCENMRYNAVTSESRYIVNEILISSNG